MTIIDHERRDDYAVAIENNRTAAVAWVNTALKKMSHDVSISRDNQERGIGYPLRGGGSLQIRVKFVRPQEETT